MFDTLKQGRAFYRRRAWGDAYRSLSLADQASPLGYDDLELLAISAYLTGRDLEFRSLIDRAHHGHLEAGDSVRAASCAFWIALTQLLEGETGQASGWLSRARRLVEGRDCVEHGYLLLPVAEQQLAEGQSAAAQSTAGSAAEIGDRFGDADLMACARHLQGRSLIQQGRVRAGLVLLDEAMLAVIAGELSPIITGLIYCSVIEACQQVYALGRAHEWTSALARWCDQQPDMVAFTGTCLVYRAEIMRFHGDWPEAMAEARRACDRTSHGGSREPAAAAYYQQAEMHRLRGEFEAAEEAYRKASRSGSEPQPGFALLRLAQGRTDAACAMIRRVVSAVTSPLERAKLLPTYVEIMVAAEDIDEASSASGELRAIAQKFDTGVLEALASQAEGTVELARGNDQAALTSLRRAFEAWKQVEAPYEAARVRVLMGRACLSMGDAEGANLEWDGAMAVFEQLGAASELAHLETLGQRAPSAHRQGLTARELQVLRLVVSGKTNKAIAAELFLSERTIDRHVSSILSKLNVPSRAAATAYAITYKLV